MQISSGQWSFGQLAVDGFFFLSGLLIVRSYLHSPSVWRYFWHRFLRIFPAFWVCLIATAFAFAPVASLWERGGLFGFFSPPTNDGPFRYVVVNALLVMKQYTISGLLSRLPLNGELHGAFNGSLWTLAPEFSCYLLVAILGSLGVLTRSRWFLVALLFVLYFCASSNGTAQAFTLALRGTPIFLSDYLVIQMFEFFVIGGLFFLYRQHIPLSPIAFVIALVIVPLACLSRFYNLFEPLALSYVLYWLAYKLPVRDFDRYGDFSYGTYIYAFPVQQLLSMYGLNGLGFFPYLALSFLCTAPLAVLSWLLVERPSLAMKNLTLLRSKDRVE